MTAHVDLERPEPLEPEGVRVWIEFPDAPAEDADRILELLRHLFSNGELGRISVRQILPIVEARSGPELLRPEMPKS